MPKNVFLGIDVQLIFFYNIGYDDGYKYLFSK